MRVKGTLTPRQKKMVEEYIICGCKRQAAIRAGFQANYAEGAFKQPSVQAYLAERMGSMGKNEKEIVHRLGICAVCTSCGGHTNCDGMQGSCVKEAADLIVRQSAEIDRLAQENAELRDQAYNLTLYLNFLIEGAPNVIEKLENDFSGMPGYNPAILEGNNDV